MSTPSPVIVLVVGFAVQSISFDTSKSVITAILSLVDPDTISFLRSPSDFGRPLESNPISSCELRMGLRQRYRWTARRINLIRPIVHFGPLVRTQSRTSSMNWVAARAFSSYGRAHIVMLRTIRSASFEAALKVFNIIFAFIFVSDGFGDNALSWASEIRQQVVILSA